MTFTLFMTYETMFLFGFDLFIFCFLLLGESLMGISDLAICLALQRSMGTRDTMNTMKMGR